MVDTTSRGRVDTASRLKAHLWPAYMKGVLEKLLNPAVVGSDARVSS